MPDLTEATEDIEPAVVQLRAAAKMMPTLLMGYFFLQFVVVGGLWGPLGCVVGGVLGLALGLLIATLVRPVFSWFIHILFLLHAIRDNQRKIRTELRKTRTSVSQPPGWSKLGEQIEEP